MGEPQAHPLNGGARRLCLALVVLAVLVVLVVLAGTLTGCVDVPVSAGAAPARTSFAGPGPFRVATRQVVTGGGDRYDLLAPASYKAVPFESPIVTWGNGTAATPDDYSTLLRHLASWGFTVIASTLPDTGSGRQILAGARYLVSADGRAASPLYHHLDTHEIAAVGHSQGATGAVRAAELGGALISTVVTFSLPWNGQGPVGTQWDRPQSLGWSFANPDCPTARDCWANPSALRQATLLVSTRGPIDAVIANPAVERCYFEEVHAPAALGIIADSGGRPADHSSIQDRANGGSPQGFLDYVTAWLLARLRHDRAAAAVYSGRHPQLLANPDWAGSAVKRRWSRTAGCQ